MTTSSRFFAAASLGALVACEEPRSKSTVPILTCDSAGAPIARYEISDTTFTIRFRQGQSGILGRTESIRTPKGQWNAISEERFVRYDGRNSDTVQVSYVTLADMTSHVAAAASKCGYLFR